MARPTELPGTQEQEPNRPTWVSLRSNELGTEEPEHHSRLEWQPKHMVKADLEINTPELNRLINLSVFYGRVELVKMEDDGTRTQYSDSRYDGKNNRHAIALNFNLLVSQAKGDTQVLATRLEEEIRTQLKSLLFQEMFWKLKDELLRAGVAVVMVGVEEYLAMTLYLMARWSVASQEITVEVLFLLGIPLYIISAFIFEMVNQENQGKPTHQYLYEFLQALHVIFLFESTAKLGLSVVTQLHHQQLVRPQPSQS